jgi:hypothetical protein
MEIISLTITREHRGKRKNKEEISRRKVRIWL